MSEKKLYLDKNLQIIFGVTLMAVLGVSSITPVLPRLIREFNVSAVEIGLVITFFTLPGIFLAPVLGVLADRFGRKRILVPSLFLFAVAGVACAFVNDFNLLLLLRGLQGIGAASLGSINSTLIGDLYSGRQRAAAMGLNSSVLSIGTASYPTIGGAIAILGWHYPFVLPVLALPIGILVITSLETPEPGGNQRLKDYLVGTWSYLNNIKVLGLFAAGIITFILLYGTTLIYLTLFLADSFGASPFIIGLLFTGVSLSSAAVSSQLGKINRKLSLRTVVILSFVLYGLAMVLVPVMPNLWMMLIPAVIFGIAHGANIPSLQTQVAGSAPPEYRAAFMSLNGTMLRIGQTLGPPLIALIYVGWGYDATFFSSCLIAWLTAAVGFVFSRIRIPVIRERS
jgi:MFS family permease